VRISDGAWHTITVQRRKRLAQIIVDGSTPVKGVADQGAVLLNTNGRLWIGEFLCLQKFSYDYDLNIYFKLLSLVFGFFKSNTFIYDLNLTKSDQKVQIYSTNFLACKKNDCGTWKSIYSA